MPRRRLRIWRDEHHVFVFSRRASLTGRHAARITARLLAVLENCDASAFFPEHDANAFAWVLEFRSARGASRFVKLLMQSHRAHPI